MNVELDKLINSYATRRLANGPERQTTQLGQIMDDARMVALAIALETHPDDEALMEQTMNDPELIQQCYDGLVKYPVFQDRCLRLFA